MTKIASAIDITVINSPKGQNDFSVPGIVLKGSDLHPATGEILNTELSVSVVCLPIHLGIVLNKVKNRVPQKIRGMPPLNTQVRCVEAQASRIIKIYRDTSILGDSVPFIVHLFVVPLLH